MVWAFFGLLIVQVLNEIVDFANSGAAPGVVWWGEHISDTVLTVFFPGMFLCVVLILTWGVPRNDGPFWSVVEQEPGRNGEQNSPDS